MGPPSGKLPILFPYHSHTNPDRYGNGMGIVWEAYQKGVPLLESVESPFSEGWRVKTAKVDKGQSGITFECSI